MARPARAVRALEHGARRFRRWAQAGVWEALFQAVQEPDYAWVLVDSTTVKAHQAAGQKKARPQPKA